MLMNNIITKGILRNIPFVIDGIKMKIRWLDYLMFYFSIFSK
jgi:hypothetical protein